MGKILDKLKKAQDKKYAEFQVKLIPTIDKKTIIGKLLVDIYNKI